jgi:hypothetical protein
MAPPVGLGCISCGSRATRPASVQLEFEAKHRFSRLLARRELVLTLCSLGLAPAFSHRLELVCTAPVLCAAMGHRRRSLHLAQPNPRKPLMLLACFLCVALAAGRGCCKRHSHGTRAPPCRAPSLDAAAFLACRNCNSTYCYCKPCSEVTRQAVGVGPILRGAGARRRRRGDAPRASMTCAHPPLRPPPAPPPQPGAPEHPTNARKRHLLKQGAQEPQEVPRGVNGARGREL